MATETELRQRELRSLCCKLRDAIEYEDWDEVFYFIGSIREIAKLVTRTTLWSENDSAD